MSIRKRLMALVLTATVLGLAVAEEAAPPELKPDHPDRHVVVRGDTLWGIASRFLKDPWRWPDIWEINPNIENPHLIYPGDVIVLVIRDGKPVLQLERPGVPPAPVAPGPAMEAAAPPAPTVEAVPPPKVVSDLKTIIQKPQVRISALEEEAIPTIPMDVIQPFLSRPRVMTKREADRGGYVVSMEEARLVGSATKHIYVRKLPQSDTPLYTLLRLGEPYRDPRTHSNLGYEAIEVGTAQLEAVGKPATLSVSQSNREVFEGDLLIPYVEEPLRTHFTPRAPEKEVKGQILAVLDGVARIGRLQTVVINLGEKQGMEPGHVLAIYQSGGVVKDNIRGGSVRLPETRVGVMMIFRTFERVSYALVLEAERDIRIFDAVKKP